jgi:hypothetical protein
MTKFKLLGVVAILSAVIATPVRAEDPLQAEEPGLWTFYHSGAESGAGSVASGTAGAMASIGNTRMQASVSTRRYARSSIKHYARAPVSATQ